MPGPHRLPWQALATFRTVAEVSNLRAAADTLHLTHSAVSQQIRGLEEALGFPLFERRGRRIVLNAAGRVLQASVRDAFSRLEDGVQAAAAAASGNAQRLRLTVLPSFGQRWLLPRIGRWRERYPDVALEIDASIRAMDLVREGFHAAVRQGSGPWPGLASERLFDRPPIIVVASPPAARRLAEEPPEAFAREPLLGDADLWGDWFAAAGVRQKVTTVAVFNDAGLMLQAAEQSLGLALSREILAADALVEGRLVQLSPIAITHPDAEPYHFVYPPGLADWPPIAFLRQWLRDELDRSSRNLLEHRQRGPRKRGKDAKIRRL